MKGKKTGGRKAGTPNKVTADVRALAQEHGQDAIAALSTIMRDATTPPAARVAAANALLDRGYGKAPQSIAVSGGDKPLTVQNQLSRDDLRAVLQTALPKLAG